MKHYIALTKPRITWLILMSTGMGYFFGLTGAVNLWALFHTIFGTGLIASGTAALNQWYERDADARMRRTDQRPLPTGQMDARKAFAFGVLLSVLGFLELGLGVNWLSAGLGLFTLLTYLCLYTPLKQISPVSTTIGAVPGAMPPLIGFAAASGTLTAEARDADCLHRNIRQLRTYNLNAGALEGRLKLLTKTLSQAIANSHLHASEVVIQPLAKSRSDCTEKGTGSNLSQGI